MLTRISTQRIGFVSYRLVFRADQSTSSAGTNTEQGPQRWEMAVLNLGSTLAITAGVTLLAIVLTFWVARVRDRYDTIDTFWGLGFALIAIVAFALSTGDIWVRATVTVLTAVWGIRLAIHLHRRNRAVDEDARYVEMIRKAGDHPGLRIFVRVYLVQGLVMWFVSLPVQFAQYNSGLGILGFLGIAIWLVGFVFESVGDHQLSQFKANPANRGQVLDTGLWRYTRHPNYFGDACVWWGLYLIAAASWLGAATVLSPIAMTLLLVRGTGKPMLEKGMRQTRPGYAEYVERTSGFFPLPPKSASGQH